MQRGSQAYRDAPAGRDAADEPHCGGGKRRQAECYRNRMGGAQDGEEDVGNVVVWWVVSV